VNRVEVVPRSPSPEDVSAAYWAEKLLNGLREDEFVDPDAVRDALREGIHHLCRSV
jgi:hypothetical protein